jgi:SSS family solute:Na+ symporter
VGESLVIWLTFTKATVATSLPWLPVGLHDLNVGIIALAANALVMVGISAVTTRPASTSARMVPS